MTRLTLGVEEEFLLVDQDGRLAAGNAEITDCADEHDGQIELEFRRCQIESATKVCENVDDLVTGLRGLRDHLATQAAASGQRLVPAGTDLLSDDRQPRFTQDSRYQRMSRDFGELARASLTCACHVHVGIPDRETGVLMSNHIRPWLPLLLALTANSPFHDGVDTEYASWRYEMWRRWPTAGPPPHCASLDDYESAVDGLLHCEAALDRGMIYWDIRLSEHQPTLEIRIADVVPTVEHAALLAVLVRALATRAIEDPQDNPVSQEVLRGELWRAARDGMSGRCIDRRTGRLAPTWQLLDRLVDDLWHYLRLAGDGDHVIETLARLRVDGDAAQRQRTTYSRRASLTDVIDSLAWPCA